MKHIACFVVKLSVGAVILSSSVALGQTVEDFYKGKQISLYVGYPAGGGYDLYARLLAAHYSKHIPGRPVVTVKNMEGGNGVRAAGYMTAVTPQDGLSLGLFGQALALGKLMGGPGDFDPSKFQWVGRIMTGQAFAAAWHTTGVRTVGDVKTRELITATTATTNDAHFLPKALNDLVGAKFKLVTGYQGSSDMLLALERGEVEAVSGIGLEIIQGSRPTWLSESKINILFTFGIGRAKDLPNVPSLVELGVDAKSRQVLSLLGGGADIGRAIAAEPMIPPDRLEALRIAFWATVSDPEFIASAEKTKISLEPMKGAELQAVVSSVTGSSADVIAAARKYFAP